MLATATANSFKLEILMGIHQPQDVYKMALIRARETRAYGSFTKNYAELGSDEVEGHGYHKGGLTLTGMKLELVGAAAVMRWDDAIWSGSTFAANGAIIYNATKDGRVVQVLNFGDTNQLPVESVIDDFIVPLSAQDGQIRFE